MVALSFIPFSAPLLAQSAPVSQPAVAAPTVSSMTVSSMTRPALDQVQQTVADVSLSKWKAKDDVREATFENISSIQRDIVNTLPGLLSQADANPAAIQPTFALYRNLDALYDVLLRVSNTASMVGTAADVSALSNALTSLESARKSLGDRILDLSQQQQAAIVKLQAAIKTAPVAAAPTATSHGVVVDDGPQSALRRKKKHAAAKSKPKPAPAQATPPAAQTNP